MSSKPAIVALLAAILLPAGAASGTELRYGTRVEAIWEDNVFFGTTDEVDDLSFRASPYFQFRDQDGELQWKLRYTPSYEYFIDNTPLKGWDHNVSADVTWRPSERFSLVVRESFQRFSSQSRLNQTTSSAVDDPSAGLELLSTRERIKRNVSGFTLSYLPTPRVFLTFDGSWTLWDYARETRRDQETTAASAQVLYGFSQRLRAGVTASWSRQAFDSTPNIPNDIHTDYYNLSATAVYEVSPGFEISFAAGPAQVDGEDPESPDFAVRALRPQIVDPVNGLSLVNATTCPTQDGFLVLDPTCEAGISVSALGGGLGGGALFPEVDDVVVVPVIGEAQGGSDDVTYFANIAVTRTWEEWQARLSYQRRDDASSSSGVSSIADIVIGRLRYTPSPRWTFTLTGIWNRRTQEQELFVLVPIVEPRPLTLGMSTIMLFPNTAATVGTLVDEFDREIEFTTINAVFDIQRRVTRRLTVFSTFFYTTEESTGDIGTGRDADRFTVRFGFTYEFEPIRFAGF